MGGDSVETRNRKNLLKEMKMDKLDLGIEGHINIGHIVNVYFVNSVPIYNAEVLYRPGAVGECWRLKTKQGIVYVQMFERMDLIG